MSDGNLLRFLETSAGIEQSQPVRRTIHDRLLQLLRRSSISISTRTHRRSRSQSTISFWPPA